MGISFEIFCIFSSLRTSERVSKRNFGVPIWRRELSQVSYIGVWRLISGLLVYSGTWRRGLNHNSNMFAEIKGGVNVQEEDKIL